MTKTLKFAAAAGVAMLAALAPLCTVQAQPAAAPAAQAAPAAPQRSIVRVEGDLYRFQNNNHYGLFLVTSAGVIVADPINLDTANWLKGEIATRFNGAKVAAVVYSHHHWDHAAGAAAFEGARVIGRPEMTAALRAGPPAGATPAQQATWQTQFKDVKAPTETWNTPVHRLTLGGKTVELHHVGGLHADDLTYVYFPAEKALMLVDVISPNRLPTIAANYDHAHQMTLIDRAQAFDAVHVLGGHGRAGPKSDLEAQRTYLNELRQAVQAEIAAGRTVEQAKANVKMDRYTGWIAYADRIGPNVEGMYAALKR